MKAITSFGECKSDEEVIVWLGNRLNPELFNKRWPDIDHFIQDYLDTGFNLINEDGSGLKTAGATRPAQTWWPTPTPSSTASMAARARSSSWWNRAATNTTSSTTRTRSSPRACCAPTARRAFRHAVRPHRAHRAHLPGMGHRPVPEALRERGPGQWTTDEDYRKKYPFTIINGNRSYEFFHSENRQQKTMREFHPGALRAGVQADGRGVRPGRRRVDMDREPCGPLQAVREDQSCLATAVPGGRTRLVVPRRRRQRAQPVRVVRLQHQQPHLLLRDGGGAASAPRSRASSGASTRSRKATRCQANRSWKKAVSAQSRRAASAKEEAT